MLNLSMTHDQYGQEITLRVDSWLKTAIADLEAIARQRSEYHGREIDGIDIEIRDGEAYGTVAIYKHDKTTYALDNFGNAVAEVV